MPVLLPVVNNTVELTGSEKVTVTPPTGVDVDPLVLVTVAVTMLTCPAVTEVAEAPIDTVFVVEGWSSPSG